MRSVLASVSLGVGGSMAKLAEACLQAGKTNEGLRTVDEALQFVLEHKEGTWEPELHRLKANFSSSAPKPEPVSAAPMSSKPRAAFPLPFSEHEKTTPNRSNFALR
jgi:hypothetical protein